MNPFLANVLILLTLKTTENQKLSGVFRGAIKKIIGQKWVKRTINQIQILESKQHDKASKASATATAPGSGLELVIVDT